MQNLCLGIIALVLALVLAVVEPAAVTARTCGGKPIVQHRSFGGVFGADTLVATHIQAFRHDGDNTPSCSLARRVVRSFLRVRADQTDQCSESVERQSEQCLVVANGSRSLWACGLRRRSSLSVGEWMARCTDSGGRRVQWTQDDFESE